MKHTITTQNELELMIQTVLKDRGIKDIDVFLSPPHPLTISLEKFFNNKTMFKKKWRAMVRLLKKIYDEKGSVVVYTDYDADGVTGGAILWETLHTLGFNVMPYIPDRKKEGYGFSEYGIDEVKRIYNPALIFSVDHGIVAHKQIMYAKKIGIPVVVTDHHQKQDKEPEDALAVFHIPELSGSGVAYFVAKEIAEEYGGAKKIEAFQRDFVALAAIGTIADLVPLSGASRNISKHGLEALSHSVRYGLRHIIKESGLDGKKITPYEVGYIIAPRINAFGRLEHAMDALRLLCTHSYGRAVGLAAKAEDINKTRQDLVDVAQKKAMKMADTEGKIIIVRHDDWEEGIIGLIAGKLMNKYFKPVIVMTKSDGHAKASVRSVPGVDITAFLTSPELRKYLIDVGGHAAAAGFSIALSNIEAFTRAAHKKANKEITNDMLTPTINVDFQIPLSFVSQKLVEKIAQLEPFGIGNPQPLFISQGIIKDTRLFGKKNQYIKILVRDEDMTFLEVTFFDKIAHPLRAGDEVKVIYTLKIDTWGGKSKVVAMGRHVEV